MDEEGDALTPEEVIAYQNAQRQAYYLEDVTQLRELINESDIPKKVKKTFWSFTMNATVLANYTPAEIAMLEERARQIILKRFALLPPEKRSDKIMMSLENIEFGHQKMARRGKGGFERRQQRTHISEATINRPQEERNKSILGRLNPFAR